MLTGQQVHPSSKMKILDPLLTTAPTMPKAMLQPAEEDLPKDLQTKMPTHRRVLKKDASPLVAGAMHAQLTFTGELLHLVMLDTPKNAPPRKDLIKDLVIVERRILTLDTLHGKYMGVQNPEPHKDGDVPAKHFPKLHAVPSNKTSCLFEL